MIEIGALAIEILAVVIIIVAIFYSMGRYLVQAGRRPGMREHYEQLKLTLGRALTGRREM